MATMASAPAPNLDSLITLKASLNGSTRRFKLPLRDLGAHNLETKLRSVLSIPPSVDCLIERYSDSSAAYVVLDPNNASVFKQLYRAAKAKQKLKLRISTKDKVEKTEEKKGPLPASVEDEPEAPASTQPSNIGNADKPVIASSYPVPSQQLSAQSQEMQSHSAAGATLRGSLAMIEREHQQMERNLEVIEASIAALQNRPATRSPPTRASPPSLETLVEAKKAPEPPATTQPMCQKPAQPSASALTSGFIGFAGPHYAVCCNSCDKTIPDAHYHCSTCDDGDFDLCQDCVDQGITCYGSDHWLLKRFVENGTFVNSTTETIAPKPKAPKPREEKPAPVPVPTPSNKRVVPVLQYLYENMRTCNSCVKELPDYEFIHCTSCEDFDLCMACFAKNQHGHHPKHAFVPAVETASLSHQVRRYLAPGRNESHNAICDGCDRDIQGIRHKCLDCPDWDYCADCVVNASFIHPGHRFVEVYERLESSSSMCMRFYGRPTHVGICCDGPLCQGSASRTNSTYIVGTRYKCAVCYDTDFCANCEASPSNNHNKTHPLIKFKTPVKQVTVTTTGQTKDGQQMPTMGDHARSTSTSSRSTATTMQQQDIVQTDVLTVADMQPSEPATPVQVKDEKPTKQEEIKTAQPALAKEPAKEPVAKVAEKPFSVDDLAAVYESDTVSDGTVLPPNHVFEQTWVIRNSGDVAWPAGSSAKFVGGDYMGQVDPNHPAGIQELACASESTVCERPVGPGELFRFSVVLRTPAREGKVISYWRLTTQDGFKFGPRLWCDVNVQAPKEPEVPAVKDVPVPAIREPEAEPQRTSPAESQGSQMIFPKLEKESPEASIHEESKVDETPVYGEEDYEDCAEDDEWAEDNSDEGFLTDEEYDILDASDEEYLEDQAKKLRQK